MSKKQKHKIELTEEEYKESKYSTYEWEQSVEIERWEHHFGDKYIIIYKDKEK
jgi:hypothetical protein